MGVFYSDSDLTVAGSGEIRAYDTVFQLSNNLTFEAGSNLKLYSDRSVTITAKNVNVYSKYLTIESKGSTCIMSSDGRVYVGPSCGRFELNTAEGIPPFMLLDGSIVLDGARLLEPVNGEMDDFCVYLDGEVANHIVFGTLAATPTPTPIPTATATPKPTATSKPVPTATAAPTSVTKPTGKADPTAAPADPKVQICAFVERIYKFVLDREPEEEGAAFWTDELYAFRRTGAEVAQGFIFSPEFENRNTTNEEFVTILYKTFFGRDPEEEGMNFWLTQLKSGTMDRVTVANGFIYSQEWADTCASYGIRSGGDLKPAGKISPTELTYAFVERMYTTALGRSYDEEGKQYWAGELANFNVTGEFVGAAFFLSDEMNGYNLSDSEYLTRLYQTFMGRPPETDGFNYWMGRLAGGMSRYELVYSFTRSPEFVDKCIKARIVPYGDLVPAQEAVG